MAKPLVVVIPHELGLAEARQRLDHGFGQVKEMLLKSGIRMAHADWTGDRLDFGVAAMGQKVDGQVDVMADSVRIEVRLPLLLALFAERVSKAIGKQGNTLLLPKK